MWNRFRIGGVIDESRGLGALEAEEVQLGMQGWLALTNRAVYVHNHQGRA